MFSYNIHNKDSCNKHVSHQEKNMIRQRHLRDGAFTSRAVIGNRGRPIHRGIVISRWCESWIHFRRPARWQASVFLMCKKTF